MHWFVVGILLYHGHFVTQEVLNRGNAPWQGPFATREACEAATLKYAPPERSTKVNLPGADEIRIGCAQIGEQ